MRSLQIMNFELGYNIRFDSQNFSNISVLVRPIKETENCIMLNFDKVLSVQKYEFIQNDGTTVRLKQYTYKVQFLTKMEEERIIEQDFSGGEEARIFESTFFINDGYLAYPNILEYRQITKYGNKPICERNEDAKAFCICKRSKIKF